MMQIKLPKNDHKYHWTMHSQFKIKQYGLSANKIKRIIRFPDRKEEGIAPNTVAVMKRRNRNNPQKGEIWVMYQRKLKVQNSKLKVENTNPDVSTKGGRLSVISHQPAVESLLGKIKIISAWVYPGVSPKSEEIFVPDDAWEELENINSKER
jgi:hypothetical protein